MKEEEGLEQVGIFLNQFTVAGLPISQAIGLALSIPLVRLSQWLHLTPSPHLCLLSLCPYLCDLETKISRIGSM